MRLPPRRCGSVILSLTANMTPPALPTEVWLEIIRWATISPSTRSLSTTTYEPFHAAPIDSVDKEAVAMKRTVVCVCKQWRELAQDLLFEDVVMSYDVRPLKEALQLGGGGDTRYRRIRRACLPYASCTPYNSREFQEVANLLQSWPELEVFARPSTHRPEVMTFDFPAAECPPLYSLKRLDWWHYNEAARSGGVNALTEVIHAAPNLQYLSIGGDLWLNLMQRGTVSLPALTTLRIRRMNVLFLQQVCRWSMPSLKHVVIDVFSTPRLLEPLWSQYGEQIRTVELGMNLKFYVMDIVCHALSFCPALEELSYYIMFTAVPHPPQQPHATLTTLRWHSRPNQFFSMKDPGFWEHLAEHTAVFTRPFFPALRRVVLHGDWSHALHDERFLPLVKKFRDRGIAIEETI